MLSSNTGATGNTAQETDEQNFNVSLTDVHSYIAAIWDSEAPGQCHLIGIILELPRESYNEF